MVREETGIGEHDTEPSARSLPGARTVADPLPLGLLGLAGASVVFTAQQLSWVPRTGRLLERLRR